VCQQRFAALSEPCKEAFSGMANPFRPDQCAKDEGRD
jgi:hypothetical protein